MVEFFSEEMVARVCRYLVRTKEIMTDCTLESTEYIGVCRIHCTWLPCTSPSKCQRWYIFTKPHFSMNICESQQHNLWTNFVVFNMSVYGPELQGSWGLRDNVRSLFESSRCFLLSLSSNHLLSNKTWSLNFFLLRRKGCNYIHLCPRLPGGFGLCCHGSLQVLWQSHILHLIRVNSFAEKKIM